jgi:hypothetical protein
MASSLAMGIAVSIALLSKDQRTEVAPTKRNMIKMTQFASFFLYMFFCHVRNLFLYICIY